MLNFTDPNKETADGERSSLQNPHPFLTDQRVRQAISMAINREVIAAPYGRGGVFSTNILAQPAQFASPNNAFEYNPRKKQSNYWMKRAGLTAMATAYAQKTAWN